MEPRDALRALFPMLRAALLQRSRTPLQQSVAAAQRRSQQMGEG